MKSVEMSKKYIEHLHLHHRYDQVTPDITLDTFLRTQTIVRQFQDYWMNALLPVDALEETKFINMHCCNLLQEREDVYENMRIQFLQGGAITGHKLFKLSQTVFEDKVNWGRMIAVFAFGAKLMHYFREQKEVSTLQMLSNWLIHVLLQCIHDL